MIGIWNDNNLLLHLNSDLGGRVEELSIFWTVPELTSVLKKGAPNLNVRFSERTMARLARDAFGTAGILQELALRLLDHQEIYETQSQIVTIDDETALTDTALQYADQLNAIYQTFAKRVASGIRERKNSTGIYAHALKAALEATDADLTNGLPVNKIFAISHDREPRIQKGNLKAIIPKINDLQVDSHGRGLVLSYDESKEELFVVDKQLLFYRKYCTVTWPWETIIADAGEGNVYGADG